MAINHREADRVPIDLGAMRSTGIATIGYNKLREKLGITKGLARMYDFVQQLAYPEKEIMDMFHIDAIDAGQAFLKSDDNWRKWTLGDNSKCLIPKYLNIEMDKDLTVLVKDNNNLVLGKKPKTSLYVDQTYWVYKDLPAIPDIFDDKDLFKHMWAIPSPPWHLDIFDDEQYKLFINNIKELHETTDYSIMLAVGCNLFEAGAFLRGMENFLCDVYIDKKGTKRLLDFLVERYLRLLGRVLKGVGEYVDILQFGDDLGSQNGPFMSPDLFREVFKPRYKKMWEFVHNESNCKIFLHSCGSIYELIPDLIDAGLEILNPVQTTTANMEPQRLKKEFGKDITFWGGGCNTQHILSTATPKEVKEDVTKRIGILGENGGFVFNQIHNILANVPPENVIAMLETAYEYGQY
ncbi:MAG: uroporphyrinogen decarboxylase family protein [bacterium]